MSPPPGFLPGILEGSGFVLGCWGRGARQRPLGKVMGTWCPLGLLAHERTLDRQQGGRQTESRLRVRLLTSSESAWVGLGTCATCAT